MNLNHTIINRLKLFHYYQQYQQHLLSVVTCTDLSSWLIIWSMTVSGEQLVIWVVKCILCWYESRKWKLSDQCHICAPTLSHRDCSHNTSQHYNAPVENISDHNISNSFHFRYLQRFLIEQFYWLHIAWRDLIEVLQSVQLHNYDWSSESNENHSLLEPCLFSLIHLTIVVN